MMKGGLRMKVEIPISKANRLINSGPVVLVTASYKDRANVMTAAWTTPISLKPMLVGVSIHPARFTHDLVKRSGEFALNVPGRPLAEKVKLCGTLSGRDVDKFKEVGLTMFEAKYIRAPLIEECIGNLECAVVEAIPLGDHTLFVGEVVAAWVEEDAFDEAWKLEAEEAKPLHHLGGDYYGVLEERIEI
jgi:flavin reductase (DIM6/NTAB) family NADH-FMN oxidoreductase RutF